MKGTITESMTMQAEHTLSHEHGQIIYFNTVHGDSYSECFLTCDLSAARENVDLAKKYELIVKKLIEGKITPIYEKAFGCLSYFRLLSETRSQVYRASGLFPERIPFNYIQGAPAVRDARWAGVHLYGICVHDSNVNVADVTDSSGCYGKIINSKGTRQAFFTGLTGKDKRNTHPVEVKNEIENVFANLSSSLLKTGAQKSDLVRTWFHLRDILGVYNIFNDARRKSYTGQIHKDCLPASTAIQGESALGREISLDAMAIHSSNTDGPIVQALSSPIQPEADTYGPLFSRGIEIVWPRYKILYISGTASIDEAGRSAHAGDPKLQIKNTLNNIYLLLDKFGATMDNIVQACAYFKNPAIEPIFDGILKQNSWHALPCLRLCGDICRYDLVFEMDGIAVVQC